MVDKAVIEADGDAIKRKQRSERILASEGVPINADLGLVQASANAQPCSKVEAALRTLCVLMTAMKAHGMDQTMVLRVVRRYGLAPKFSPSEKEFVRDPSPAEDAVNKFKRRYEAAWALLWALGYVDGLDSPNKQCDAKQVVNFMRERKTRVFIRDANLRSIPQILDQADLLYRYQWSVRDAAKKRQDAPASLIAFVIDERLHALNWLARYPGTDWDAISD